MIKFLKHFLLGLILLVLQIAVIPVSPGNGQKLHVILVVVLFIGVAYKFHWAVLHAVFLGVMMDLYSALPFGVILVALMGALYFAFKVYEKLLTNKSFYTLLGLTVVATVAYNFIIGIYFLAVYFFQAREIIFLRSAWIDLTSNIGWQIGFNLLLAAVLFVVFHFSSARFNAVFIDTTKS